MKVLRVGVLGLVGATMALSQIPTDQPTSGGWRKFSEQRADSAPDSPQPLPADLPPQLTLPAGAWITVRVNEPLSSNHNLQGDAFTATLTQPLVVQGFVVARRGQTIAGRVAEVEKAGRVKGTSRLGIELTEISLVDGRQLPVRTELIQYQGDTSKGRDATAVATTAGAGAAIGAAADGGFGAGVGALAGAAASVIGVLVTRGRETLVLPEDLVTFRTQVSIAISTEGAEHAFQAVRQEDYEPKGLQRRVSYVRSYPPPYLPPFYPGYSVWPYSPFFYGPGVFIYSRPVFLHGRSFHRWR